MQARQDSARGSGAAVEVKTVIRVSDGRTAEGKKVRC